MGVVWLADDKLLGERVALKFLPTELSCDPAALQSLRTETLRSRKLSHPHILRIHDLVDAPNETVFIAMEYVDGPNLHTLRAERPEKVLTWDFLAPLVAQLCAALAYAHDEKVIHRDIKPANLMLDDNGRLKLADFGLARVISDSVSRLSGTLTSGTPVYMSPQQADGKIPRITDDIYSLGATLYELLTSTPPFYSADIAYQIRNIPAQPISERLKELGLSNEIPERASALIMACLAKDPEKRPQNARDILSHLDGLSNSVPKPRRSSTLAKAAIVLGLLAIGVTGWAVYRHSTRPRPPLSGGSVEAGFTSLFNGKDLTGWDCEPNVWSVHDGAIIAFSGEEGVTRKENTCLIWKGAVTNFVLRLSFRLRDVITEKPANSGVLYRSRRVQNWHVRGYQCDLHGLYTGTLILLEDDKDPRSVWGHKVGIKPTSDRPVLLSKGVITAPEEFKDTIKFGDWNDLEIMAQGARIIHTVNGVVTMEAIDETLHSPNDGLLALELKRATNLQVKNIRLKPL
jgi:serine/threonine protein kinase